LASSTPGHVGKRHLHFLLHIDLGFALADRHEALALSHAAQEEPPDAEEEHDRHNPGQHVAEQRAFDDAGDLHLMFRKILEQVRVFDTNGVEDLVLFQFPVNDLRRDRDFGDLARRHGFFELAVGDFSRVEERGEKRLKQDQHPEGDEHVPDGKLPLFRIHKQDV
jgi:hypothetical protein